MTTSAASGHTEFSGGECDSGRPSHHSGSPVISGSKAPARLGEDRAQPRFDLIELGRPDRQRRGELDDGIAPVVGAASVPPHHTAALRRLDFIEIAATCDLDLAAARELAAASGVANAATGLAGIAASRPQLVYVLTPPASHAITALVRELALQSQLMARRADHWLLRVERESLNQPTARERLRAALEVAGHTAQIEIEVGQVSDSPARRNAVLEKERQRLAHETVMNDPFVQTLV